MVVYKEFSRLVQSNADYMGINMVFVLVFSTFFYSCSFYLQDIPLREEGEILLFPPPIHRG